MTMMISFITIFSFCIEVYYGVKKPREALDDAAAKSALIL
jgi:hypothetical protein